MSVTYTDDNRINTVQAETAFVPSYARGSRKKKPVRTWMILAPIGALALIGGGAAMLMSNNTAEAPLAEEPAPFVAATPSLTTTAPLESSLPSNASATVTPITPAPVVREVTPTVQAPRSTPRTEIAPLRRAVPAPAAREAAPSEPTGLRPYTPSAQTGALNSSPAPTQAPAPTVPPPVIAVEPLN